MISPPESLKLPIHIPQMRLLMGPGPSNVSERVLKAQALPTLGHLHPEFCKVHTNCIIIFKPGHLMTPKSYFTGIVTLIQCFNLVV